MLSTVLRKRKYSIWFHCGICFFLFACGKPPPRVEESILVAHESLSSGNTEQAIVLLEDLLQRNPGHPAVLENLAFAYAQSGRHEMAAFYFSETADTGPDKVHFLLYAAEALDRSGKKTEAAENYVKYLVARPDSPVEWKKLGRLQEESNEFRNAAESYLQSQKLRPNGDNAIRLGKLFRKMNNRAQANNWFKAALESADGAEGDALLGLFEGALLEENYGQAEDWLTRLDDAHPGFLDQSHLARSRRELEQWRRRQDELQKQLLEQERIAKELRERATRRAAEAAALAETRKLEEEEARKMEAARIKEPPPPTAEGYLRQARDSHAAGRGEAIKYYWASLKLDDKPAEIWHELSGLLLKEGKPGLSEATAMEAIRREPLSILYTMHYLRVAQETKDPEPFMEELISAKRKIPDSPDITLALARGYKSIRNNYREAAALYREFLERAPNHPEWSKAQTELTSLPVN